MRVKVELTLPDHGWEKRLDEIKKTVGPGAYHGMEVRDCQECYQYGVTLCNLHKGG